MGMNSNLSLFENFRVLDQLCRFVTSSCAQLPATTLECKSSSWVDVSCVSRSARQVVCKADITIDQRSAKI